ncbi:hypothetical protein Pla163_19530 [Planctomycetes bacterium Pla163]|uniref:PDZ domain-containing protein n=1 Tax=Rohdeia mirabilis TaxID=2528008 RepID=A0A518D048_9BACT|nr:hypothetical protein Pla163_19530 [Planctomycetes bacterium Pla163]
MSARQPLALALVAGLIGLLMGFLAAQAFAPSPGSAADAGPVRLSDDAAPTASSTSAPGPATLVADDGSDRRASSSQAKEASFAPSPAAVDRAIAKIESPMIADLAREGTITGTVVDRAGRPLAGAVVVATRARSYNYLVDPTKVGRASEEPDDLETYLRERAEDWAKLRTQTSRTRSLASGGFELEGLDPDSTYRVSASADGHTVFALGDNDQVACGETVSFVAEPVCALTIELRGPDGALLEEGAVQLRRGSNTTNYEWSAAEPTLRIKPGPCQLRGYAEVFESGAQIQNGLDAGLASEEVSTNASADGAADAPIVLTLLPRVGVRGRVVGGGNSRMQNIVRIMPIAAGEEYDEEALGRVETNGWQQNGRFAFYDLAPGRYAVGATTWQGAVLAHEIVDLVAGVIELELTLEDVAPESMIAVRALDPEGLPVFIDSCSMMTKYENGSSTTGLTLMRRERDVSYYMDPNELQRDGKADERVIVSRTLSVADQVFGAATVELGPDQRDVVVQFAVPVSLLVNVARVEESGTLGRLQVSIAKVDEVAQGSNGFYYGYSGMGFGGGGSDRKVPLDGEVRFDSIAPGRYTVSLAIGERWNSRTVDTREVDVLEGEVTVDMVAPVLYDLRVVAPQVAKGTNLFLRERKEGEEERIRRSFRGGMNATVDEQGNAIFEDLVAGDYTLSANGLPGEMNVSVPSTDVLFDARSPDALRVTISDVEGRLYLAGVRSGDIVIAVSGVDAGSADAMRNALYRPEAGVEQTLTVLREGSQMTFTLAAQGTGDSKGPGGSLRPTFSDE